ncbi:MAG: type II secretion system protein GspG [Gemmatimonadales bacterium]
MTKLLLLCVLALLTWYYFPETRAMLLDVAEPVVVPLARWSTEEEMAQVARNVVDQERLTGALPKGAAWLEWLESRYATADMMQDPWGSTYQLEASKDSVWILSYGADRTRNTEDDFRVATPRIR